MTTPKLLFSIAALLVAFGPAACDSNPTPHPGSPDVTQSPSDPDGEGAGFNNEGDPEDLGPDGGRDNEDDGDAGPVASVDAAPSEVALEEVAEPCAGDVNDGETGECSGESDFDNDYSPNQGAADPTDSASEDGDDDDDDDDDDAPPLTPPGRAGSPLEGVDWPRRR